MQSVTDYWNEREFMAFLLLYASQADAVTTDDEIAFIAKNYGADALNSVKPLFEQQSDFENIQTITAVKERFYPGIIGKKTIMDQLVGLFEADGKFSPIERVVMNALNRLFD